MLNLKLNAETANIDEVLNLIWLFKEPAMIWGEPGLGKTMALNELVSNSYEIEDGVKRYYRMMPVLAGSMEPTDLGGIPFPAENNLYTEYLVPQWAFYCSNHPSVPEEWTGPVVLFFDDITTADEQTQSTFHKFVHERLIGNCKVRDNVRVIAAGNRVDDKAAAREMITSLANRFAHYNVYPSQSLFCEWGVHNGIHQNVIAYLRTCPHMISTFDKGKDSSEQAFATPRTWEMFSRHLHIMDGQSLRSHSGEADDRHDKASASNLTFQVGRGIIGQGVALDFNSWIQDTVGLVSPNDIIKDPEGCDVPDINNPGACWATVTACERVILDKPKEWKKFATYCLRLQSEFGMLLGTHVVDAVLTHLTDEQRIAAISTDVFDKLAKEWEKHYNV